MHKAPLFPPLILIVRPPRQALADVAVCEEAGWRAQIFSPMDIEADHEAVESLNERARQADAVFWVSPSAVSVGARAVDFTNSSTRHIAVGEGTKKGLSVFCPYEVLCPSQGNDSEAVWELPVWKQLPLTARILIVRGHGGRNWLIEKLTAKGFTVDVAEVYFRRERQLDWVWFQQQQPQAAFVASAECVRLLFGQVPPSLAQLLKTLLYLTHHVRIAEALKAAGAEHIRVIPKLDAHALNHALYGEKNE
ncbi:uroporphyrinogen-III synthase [Neisseria sp. S1]|uniref:uroporphyrinogen-III synthase n=1 Tax=Neisseria sp. S1 TaxID=3318354 RepID=UPI003A89C074